MKENLCEERHFGVLKTLKTQELPEAMPPGPLPGIAPGPHQRPLSGHLDPTPLRLSVRYARFSLLGHKTLFIQHPAVPNPAHAHGIKSILAFIKNETPLLLQWRSQYRGKGGRVSPLTAKKIVKNREKEGKIREKRGKIRKKLRKRGKIRKKNQEGSFTLPLRTNRAGYATALPIQIRLKVTFHQVYS